MSLQTPRLIIREFKTTDWSAVHAYASKLDVMKFIRYAANTEADTSGFIKRAIESSRQTPRINYERAVVLRNDPEILIGGCGIGLIDEESRVWSMGYVYHSDYWGQGYGTEVARALLAFGFTTLNAHRIRAYCDIENMASARIMEKCGMRREAHFREKVWGLGQWRDELEYAILDHEWQTSEINHEEHDEK